MCGIAGIIEVSRKPEVKRLNGMLNLLSHRGPDNTGIFQDGNTCLGHCRLSIIDLSSNANQPMVYGNKAAVVYNGEIYTFGSVIWDSGTFNSIIFILIFALAPLFFARLRLRK